MRAAPLVRLAVERDDERLAAFRCSSGRWFQDEVEQFVRGARSEPLLIPERRVLLFELDSDVVAVGAHQPGRLVVARGETDTELVPAAQLVVVAIAHHLHGAVLPSGARLSDWLMRHLLADALETHDAQLVFAIVALENQRSLTLCERNGLTSQTAVNARYARVTGTFARAVDG